MTTTSEKAALLVMDVQVGIRQRLPNAEEFLARVQAAVDAAHAKQIPVIFVIVGFRQGHPEVSEHNKIFSAIKVSGTNAMVNPAPEIAPVGDDVVVTKRRVSAFSGSDLEVILRAQEIHHLVLAGVATSGVVLSTVREAADKDYQLTVLSDLCFDADPQIQGMLVEKIFPRQATVITGEEWAKTL